MTINNGRVRRQAFEATINQVGQELAKQRGLINVAFSILGRKFFGRLKWLFLGR